MWFRSLLALAAVAGLVHGAATDSDAEKVPLLACMANENANPARLAIFKKGLEDPSRGQSR